MKFSPQKVGIIAGGGALPIRIAEACQHRGDPYLVLATDEFADEIPAQLASVRIPLSKLGRAFSALRQSTCRDVVFAGQFERPGGRVRFRPDFTAAWFFVRHLTAFRRGDDTLHRIMAREFERAGFRVVSPLDVAPSLAAAGGYLTQTRASKYERTDLLHAFKAAKAHGRSDEGQAVVLRQGVVVGREGRRGTDAMLREISHTKGKGGILAKAMKPDQIRAVDPPAIGASTVEAAATAGLDGLVIEAGSTVIVDLETVVATADRLGLFIYGVHTVDA